jgi:hypothetical protein
VPETEVKQRDVRPFTDWLLVQRRGATNLELSDALNEVVAAVSELGKKGEIVLKITVKPGGDGMVTVEDEIKLKAPEPDRSASLYFIDEDANLHREDPRQTKLDLREVGDNVRGIGS